MTKDDLYKKINQSISLSLSLSHIKEKCLFELNPKRHFDLERESNRCVKATSEEIFANGRHKAKYT